MPPAREERGIGEGGRIVMNQFLDFYPSLDRGSAAAAAAAGCQGRRKEVQAPKAISKAEKKVGRPRGVFPNSEM